jgi:hypothetical protein
MDHYRGAGKVDPDYESYNSALELNEEEDKKENLSKIKKIIEDEYNREIIQRQQQIEEIELQICKARKLLHLLRYALIMSYYKKKELEYNGTEDEASASDNFVVPDKQNRIHPAVKKLLGKNIHNLDHLNLKDKRKSSARNAFSSSHKAPEPPLKSPESKKIKLDLEVSQSPETITNEVLDKNEANLDFIRNRKKTKYRIVVGNISKWMPSSEEDILTHKWMVYVRGPKEAPDVSHFIDKVVYYLHPSYKPHDVVEVSESPFHLSRRGWGEFPVRVQIFFKVTLNKPIDVVHNIKLDKTYSGRQTLGNETLVDVFLYDDNKSAFKCEPELNNHNCPLLILEEDIKIEELDLSEVASTSTEHDYCSGAKNKTNEKPTNDRIIFDHPYCRPTSYESLPKVKREKVEQDESNKLIYGLDSYLRESKEEEEDDRRNRTIITANTFNHLGPLNRKDIKFSNTKIIVLGKKIDGCILTNWNKLTSARLVRDVVNVPNKYESNSFKVSLPKNAFKNMGEALPYLFKRLPLYSELASNVSYKRVYPFTASTLKDFVSWNVGKRRSSEWSRARIIKNILVSEGVHGAEKWSTKAVLMYGRSHDYTPFISYDLFNRDSDEKNLLLSCFATSAKLAKNNLVKSVRHDDPDVTVNVDSDTDVASPKKNNTKVVDISDPHLKLECSYVRQSALDCGIILKPEEIDEGVRVNGAELMILEAVKCLAENLIRRAKNHRVCTRILSPSTSAINKEDVEVAINERPEMFSVKQYKKERRNFEYFS